MPLRSTALATLLALGAGLGAPALRAETRPFQSFDIGRGLAGDRVYDLAIDSGGQLWIATLTGISRFDGREFENFDMRHGLPFAVVPRLLVTRDGWMYAGTNRGLARLDPRAAVSARPFRKLATDADKDGGRVALLVEAPDGTVWGGGELGLFRIEPPAAADRFTAVDPPAGAKRLVALAPDGRGGLWAAFDGGLFRRRADGAWSGPFALPREIEESSGINDLAVDAQGALWLLTRNGLCAVAPPAGEAEAAWNLAATPLVALGALRIDGAAEPRCVDRGHGFPPTLGAGTIRPSAAGGLLVATSSALVEVTPAGARIVYRPEPGQPFEVTVAAQSADGTLWIGTRTTGLLRLPASGITTFGVDTAISGNLSTLVARGEELLAVTDFFEPKRRLFRHEAGRFVDRTPPGAERLEATFAWGATSALGPDGAWWVTAVDGLRRFPRTADGRFGTGEMVLDPKRELGAHAGALFRVFFDRADRIWLSGDEPPTLARFDPATGGLVEHREIEAFGLGPATVFAETSDGAIWIGFYQGGLARRSGEKFERMFGDDLRPRGTVFGLELDRSGRLWVASAGSGLLRIDDPLAAAPTLRAAAPGSEIDTTQVYDVAEDGLGRILAATARGAVVVDPEAGIVERLTSADGLPVSWVGSLARTSDGATWIGTERGVARYRPRASAERPTIRIAALSIAGRPVDLPFEGAERIDLGELPWTERALEIEVATPHLGAGAPPRIEWRVGEGDWSAPTDDRRLRLAGFEAGTLRLEARAVSFDGRRSEKVAAVEAVALPPLWRRPWFAALVVALVAAALAFAYRLRVARLLALERVRTRIASDLHDDLGSSLSRISILSEVARRQSDAAQDPGAALEEIGASARGLAEMAGDIVWAIDPQKDDLASLVARLRRFGSDLFEPLGTRFAIEAPDDAASIRLAAAARRDLYLLLKEALNNAAKYARASSVALRFARAGGRLDVELVDDGVGFDPGAPARGGGHGLGSLRERAGRLGGPITIDSAPGRGTRVALSVPI